MPEITIQIGGRDFEVVCKDGEEDFLHSAAAMLDVEASALNTAMGRIPESRMLLMSGLMLADKTASLEDQLAAAAREKEGGQLAHEISAEMDGLKAELAAAQEKIAAAEKALADKTVEADETAAALAEKTEEVTAKTAEFEDRDAKLTLALETMERMVIAAEEKGA